MSRTDSVIYQFAMELSNEATSKAIKALENQDMDTFNKQAERSRYWLREADHIAEVAIA